MHGAILSLALKEPLILSYKRSDSKDLMDYKFFFLLLLSLLSIIGSGFLFFKKKDKNFSVSVLTFFLLILGLIFLETFVINYFGHDNLHPLIVLYSYLFFVLCLLLPPTFYLYTLSLVKKKKEFFSIKTIQWCYGPAVFLFSINIFSYVALYNIDSESNNYAMIRTVLTFSNFISLFFVFLLQNVFFIFNSWRLYYEQKTALQSSQINEPTTITLRWMGWFISLYTILIISLYIFQLTPLFPGKILFRVFTLIYIGLIIYFGNNNYQFVLETSKWKSLDEEKRAELERQLTKLMEEEKPYLNSDLTLSSLAGQLNTNSRYLSYLINKEFDCNFSTFINNYRIKEAKNFLIDPQNQIYTIQTISEMTGFKSKSAFNSAFKRETNLTPSKYKVQHLNKN